MVKDMKKPVEDLDAQRPGEVFARVCPGCGEWKQTADATGKTKCRRCLAKEAASAPKEDPKDEPDAVTGETPVAVNPEASDETNVRMGESLPMDVLHDITPIAEPKE